MKLKQLIKKKLPEHKDKKNIRERLALQTLLGFVIVMMALTVLSRTAASITTAHVSIDNPKGGRIEHKVEAEGTLEAQNEERIEASEGFRIQEIYVETGDQVEVGDALIQLDTKDLEEKLEAAEVALRKLELQMEQLILETPELEGKSKLEIAEEALERLQEDVIILETAENLKITRAEEKVQKAKEDLAEAQQNLEDFTSLTGEDQLKKAQEDVAVAKKALDDQKYEQEKALKLAQMAVDNAREQLWLLGGTDATHALQALERAEVDYEMTSSDWQRKIKEAETTLKKAKETLQKLESGELDQAAIKAEEEKVKVAERLLKEQEAVLEDTKMNKQLELDKMARQVEDAGRDLEDAKEQEEVLLKGQDKSLKQQVIRQELLQLDIDAKAKEISTLHTLKAEGGLIEAQVAGIIGEVHVEEGAQTTGGTLLTLVSADMQYVFESEISKEDAKYIEVGDPVKIVLDGEKTPLENTIIEKIENVSDKGSENKKVSVIVAEGEPGMHATMTIVKETDKYPNVVPIEAVYQDNQGLYVLIVREQTTTLGVQMIVERVDVLELDRNQKSVAVQGMLSPKDQLIIGSNKPISAGDSVRLKQ